MLQNQICTLNQNIFNVIKNFLGKSDSPLLLSDNTFILLQSKFSRDSWKHSWNVYYQVVFNKNKKC